jgi:hypothetical protein
MLEFCRANEAGSRAMELASLPRNGMIVFEVPVPSADANPPMNAMDI